MYYSSYFNCDLVNGEGVRCTLFVSGCSHACEGCYNEKTWHPKFGDLYTPELENQIIADLQNTKRPLSGLSLTGGDPMYKNNVPVVLALMKRVKQEAPGKTIWLWTGYTLDELKADELRSPMLEYIDVLVDGKFQLENRDITLQFRGSPNQCIHKLT